MGELMCISSPKLQDLCGHLYQCFIPQRALDGEEDPSWEKRRVLIFIKWPAVHWELVAFLKNLGLETLSLRSGLPESEKREAIERFNDPDDDIDVLVSHFSRGAVGVNLPHAESVANNTPYHFQP
jgi:superfamily II DNA/RNA helicase